MSEQQLNKIKSYRENSSISREAKAMKALRLLKGLSRKQAGELCGVSARAFEQLENGRNNMSYLRIQKYVSALGSNLDEFNKIKNHVNTILREQFELAKNKKGKDAKKPRRYLLKLITKEARVIRILRKRKRISQDQASFMCGYSRPVFGNLENGRINITEERISHILKSLSYSRASFDELLNSELLRDEILDKCAEYLEQLEDNNLKSAETVIKALVG